MRGFLGLGSNEPGRRAQLWAARRLLGAKGVAVVATSPVYETAPQGEILDQPDFLNCCLEVETELGPLELLDACKAIEAELGRKPGGPRDGPRPIDVDVLLLGDIELSDERLTLPHPQIASRRFVLQPLLDLDPGLKLPDGTALAPQLAVVEDQRIAAVEPLDDPVALTLARYELTGRVGVEEVARHHYTRDIELHQDPSFPDADLVRGRSAVVASRDEILKLLGKPDMRIEAAVGNEDLVAVAIHLSGVAPTSDMPLEWKFMHVTRLRDGLVTELHSFRDAPSAAEFAGIPVSDLEPGG